MTTAGDWNPLKELLNVQKRMNSLFESALARTDFETGDGIDSWIPVADVMETQQSMIIELELPGMEQDQIQLKIEGDELIVSGERTMDRDQAGEQYHRVERSYGKFSRRFRLPSTVRRDAVDANFKHGMLHIEIPNHPNQAPGPIQVNIS
jgi:HSP20 family protein